MPPVKSSVFEHFLKLSKGKDGNWMGTVFYFNKMTLNNFCGLLISM